MTLIEKAKKSKGYRVGKKSLWKQIPTREREVAVLAWLDEEITTAQFAKAVFGADKGISGILYYVAVTMRDMYRKGKLTIKK